MQNIGSRKTDNDGWDTHVLKHIKDPSVRKRWERGNKVGEKDAGVRQAMNKVKNGFRLNVDDIIMHNSPGDEPRLGVMHSYFGAFG